MGDNLIIKVTDRLIDYADKLGNIKEDLSAILTKIEEILNLLVDGEVYKGQNSNELLMFYQSLYQHVEKMYIIYQIGENYIEKTYEEIVQRDAQLSLSFSVLQ